MRATDSEWEMLCNGFGELTDKELCDKVAESLLIDDTKTLARAKIELMNRMVLMSEEELDHMEKYAKDKIANNLPEYQSITCVIPPKRMSKRERKK